MIQRVVGILNIGPFELLLVAGAAVLLFGGDLPDVARKAARFVHRMRAMTSELSRELTASEGSERGRDGSARLGAPELGEARRALAEAARLDRTVPAGPGEGASAGGGAGHQPTVAAPEGRHEPGAEGTAPPDTGGTPAASDVPKPPNDGGGEPRAD